MFKLIVGPMFAGKTNTLFVELSKESFNKKSVLYRHEKDTRFGDEPVVISHSNMRYEANIASSVDEIIENMDNFDVIGIEEGHFWPRIVECVRTLLDSGKTVIVTMLNGDYNRKPFEHTTGLYSLVTDPIVTLFSKCYECGTTGPFTKLINKQLITHWGDKLVSSAGEESYQPACLEHWKIN